MPRSDRLLLIVLSTVVISLGLLLLTKERYGRSEFDAGTAKS